MNRGGSKGGGGVCFLWGGGGGGVGGGVHLNYFGIQEEPSQKISHQEGGHHILQDLPVKSRQPRPPRLPPKN